MIAPALEALTALDPALLYVFVAGPGVGEGIAIAMPGGGWILVDGCKTGGPAGRDVPLLAIVRRLRRGEEPIEWMILTHPHEDHAGGFAEAIGELDPANVGIAGPPPPKKNLRDEIAAWCDAESLTAEDIRKREVLAAVEAIGAWERRWPGRALASLHDGVVIRSAGPPIYVRAPNLERMTSILSKGWPKIRRRANCLSVVLEIALGENRVLLGGDLPVKPDLGTGWRRVLESHPHLASGCGLKVPHHGSKDALHESLLNSNQAGCTWWVTPYSSSGLPSPAAGDGLERLLGANARLQLTTVVHEEARKRLPASDAPLTLAEYRALVAPPPASGFIAGAQDIRPPALSALEPVWAAAFDGTGALTGQWRGPAALRLVP